MATPEAVLECTFDERGQVALTVRPGMRTGLRTATQQLDLRPAFGPNDNATANSIVLQAGVTSRNRRSPNRQNARYIARFPFSESTSTMAVTGIRWRWSRLAGQDLLQPGFRTSSGRQPGDRLWVFPIWQHQHAGIRNEEGDSDRSRRLTEFVVMVVHGVVA
jgi:hypothetical protein